MSYLRHPMFQIFLPLNQCFLLRQSDTYFQHWPHSNRICSCSHFIGFIILCLCFNSVSLGNIYRLNGHRTSLILLLPLPQDKWQIKLLSPQDILFLSFIPEMVLKIPKILLWRPSYLSEPLWK